MLESDLYKMSKNLLKIYAVTLLGSFVLGAIAGAIKELQAIRAEQKNTIQDSLEHYNQKVKAMS